MVSAKQILKINSEKQELLHKLNACAGWIAFCKALSQFVWRPEKCAFVTLKDHVDDLNIIDVIYISKKTIRLVIKITYLSDENYLYFDHLQIDFTERELNYKVAMKQWIRNKNIKAQEERQKSDWQNLRKLIHRYKNNPKFIKLLRSSICIAFVYNMMLTIFTI